MACVVDFCKVSIITIECLNFVSQILYMHIALICNFIEKGSKDFIC